MTVFANVCRSALERRHIATVNLMINDERGTKYGRAFQQTDLNRLKRKGPLDPHMLTTGNYWTKRMSSPPLAGLYVICSINALTSRDARASSGQRFKRVDRRVKQN